jgi:hypothetical protein
MHLIKNNMFIIIILKTNYFTSNHTNIKIHTHTFKPSFLYIILNVLKILQSFLNIILLNFNINFNYEPFLKNQIMFFFILLFNYHLKTLVT